MDGTTSAVRDVARVASPECLICGTALAGPLSFLFRAAGIRRSPRNPNICSRCNTHSEEGRIAELTVLFADLTSFTALTHELGPERTHEVVDAFLKTATYALVKHGAFIDKYIGDAVMAFFNAPIRYDDHAARAVASALEIQAEMPSLAGRFGLELRASIGVASGWARVGRLGSGDGKDYTAIGDVVNLAARLEGQARPGEVVVDRDVFAQVAGDYPEVRPELLPLKGFPDLVPSYRLGGNGVPISALLPVHRPPEQARARGAAGIGTIVFALLGAPCAAAALIGPLAVVLGLGAAAGALAVSVLSVLDQALVRIPLLLAATAGSLANLYTVWYARQLRRQSQEAARALPMTRLERRRTIVILTCAALALLAVAYELYAHQFITHHPWP